MFRLILPLALMPTIAAADWSPRPLMFSYDATLDVCLTGPADDLAGACADALTAAYTLKRAVAWATVKCHPEDLSTCAIPFEDEGLPHVAVRIAVDVACDATDVLQLDEGPIPQDHCISIASDIMIDEGVVPLFTDIGCGIDWIECGDLANIHAAFWVDQVDLAAPADPVINDLQVRNANECGAQAAVNGGWATDLNALECLAARSAALWADLAQLQGNN